MTKRATVSFPVDQFDDDEPRSPVSEQPLSFEGEYQGMSRGRMHVFLDPELDQAFLDKMATIRIDQSFNKEYRGIYVGDDSEGSAVFDEINKVR